MNIKEIKYGALLSYALIFINTLYGLFFTPFLISRIGDGGYGVYKIIGSLIGSLTILDMGIGSTVLRYTAKFNAEKDLIKIGNFSAMGMIQASILSGIMVFVSILIYFQINKFYSDSLTPAELLKARQLFLLFIIIIILNTYEKVIFGIISGCEHYIFGNSAKILRISLKFLISFFMLSKIADSACLLYTEIFILIVFTVLQIFYILKIMKIKIKIIYWDPELFRSSIKYTFLIFIQSIALQFNGNLDNMVIGAVVSAAAVAIYSIGLQFFNMFEQFAVAFSDLMLPSISNKIAENACITELENTVIKIGRFEFMALGGVLCAYLMIGREFILLWLGESYLPAWTVGLILMIPASVPLVQNVCLSILRAQNKMRFRTAAIFFMAIFNLIITVMGVKRFGPLAACAGTAAGLIFANIIAMNIYYIKVIKLNIFRIFKNIYSRIWLCCVAASWILWFSGRFLYGNWYVWLIKALIFCVVYASLLMLFGMNKNEKNIIFGNRRQEQVMKGG